MIYISINHIYSFGYSFKRYAKTNVPGKKTGRKNGLNSLAVWMLFTRNHAAGGTSPSRAGSLLQLIASPCGSEP
ncbi:hypothetical protein, partial [Pseudomonas sp. PB120]|uniref:hypothetical protein n=1 Tax=Pseudomonas sp. PB120 TaxID=2494700 RepID=UPI001C49AFED